MSDNNHSTVEQLLLELEQLQLCQTLIIQRIQKLRRIMAYRNSINSLGSLACNTGPAPNRSSTIARQPAVVEEQVEERATKRAIRVNGHISFLAMRKTSGGMWVVIGFTKGQDPFGRIRSTSGEHIGSVITHKPAGL